MHPLSDKLGGIKKSPCTTTKTLITHSLQIGGRPARMRRRTHAVCFSGDGCHTGRHQQQAALEKSGGGAKARDAGAEAPSRQHVRLEVSNDCGLVADGFRHQPPQGVGVQTFDELEHQPQQHAASRQPDLAVGFELLPVQRKPRRQHDKRHRRRPQHHPPHAGVRVLRRHVGQRFPLGATTGDRWRVKGRQTQQQRDTK